MPGAVFNSTSFGVDLYNSALQNPATIASGATITNIYAGVNNGDAVYGDSSAAWTVYNFGTAEGTLGGSSGIRLAAGGDVHNGSSAYTGARIAGDIYGIAILGAPGTVTNYGTIEATAGFSIGVYADDGSTVTNGASGQSALITGYTGVHIAGIGTVTNYGTICGVGGYSVGVSLYGGGLVTNRSGGLIAAEYGISVGIGAGTIVNFGTIFGDEEAVSLVGAAGTVDNYGTLIGQYGYGAYLQAGGTVTNELGGLITGLVAGVKIDGAVGLVVNSGDIGNGTGGGIYIQAGGTVTNNASGRIVAYVDGIFLNGGPGTVTNLGTIETPLTGGGGTGVQVNSGIVINGTTGAIIAASGLAVEIGANGTLVNYGTIANADGYAVRLQAGGTLVSGAGGAGTALIAGYDGVRIYGPSAGLTNYGTIASNGTGFGAQGVDFLSGGVLSNQGTILGLNTYASGVNAGFGNDLIINGGPFNGNAIIAGWLNGIDQFNGTGTIVNYGTVSSSNGDGVYLQTGGTVTNTGGLIVGYNSGVRIASGGTVVNTGTIVDTASTGNTIANAITIGGGGVVNNDTLGLISGTYNGVRISGALGTVVNSGTIVGTGAYSGGASLYYGGTIVNNAGGIIDGLFSGAWIVGGNGTVINYGTLLGSGQPGYGLGVFLEPGYAGTIAVVANKPNAQIYGDAAGVEVYLGYGTLLNFGTVSSGKDAVYFHNGGTVTNYGGGLISAYRIGVNIGNAVGSVINSGTITGQFGLDLSGGVDYVNNSGTVISSRGLGYGSGGVFLRGGGDVVNSGIVQASGGLGVYIGGGAGSVVNSGTISSQYYAGYSYFSVYLRAGGAVTNQAAGLIDGSTGGIAIAGATGNVTNYGSINGAYSAIYLAAGGTVTNQSQITGTNDVVLIRVDGLVTNYGTIIASAGTGVWLADGGTVTNYGLITGTDDVVFTGFTTGTVINYGTIIDTGIYGDGVCLDAGGTVFNAGLISGPSVGVNVQNASGNVVNSYGGTIAGGGVYLRAGGTVSNASTGLIEGAIQGIAVGFGTGSVFNYGTIAGTGANSGGIYLTAGGTVTNAYAGIITGTTDGVIIGNATGTPGATGLLLNYGTMNGGVAIVTNSGEISATGTGGNGIHLLAGGALLGPNAIANYGAIAGGSNGVFFVYDTNIANYGLITGTSLAGIYGLSGIGVVTNLGTISGGAIGVQLAGGSTLFNAGTIAGGSLSVYFTGGSSRVAIDPSAVFIGNIDAQLGGGDVIELAPGTGVFGGFDTSFIGFEQIAVDAGGDWQISGPVTFGAGFILTDAGALDFDNDLINDGTLNIETGAVLSFTGTVSGSGVIDFNGPNGVLVIGVPSSMSNSIVDFAPTDVIDFVGIGPAASYSYGGGVLRLRNSGGTQIAQSYLTTTVTNPHFTLGTDGISGAVISVNAPTGTFTGTYFNGVVLSNPTAQNPALVTSTAFITNNYGGHSGDAVYGTNATAWNLTNQGTIATNPTATSAAGVRFQAGGTVSNAAIISGGINGVVIGGGAGVVVNYGTIRSTTSLGNAVAMSSGGTAVNFGLISSARTGISFTNVAGTINNAGTVVSTAPLSGTRGAGVYLGAGGVITNQAGGLITAYRAAVSLAFFGTTNANAVVTNYGVLIGSTGISIGAGDTGDNTIVNFGTITGTSGIAILLGGGDDEIVINSYSQLNGAVGNFQPGDTFDLPFLVFSSAETVSLDASSVLRINQNGALVYSIQLDPSQNFGINEFELANDGTGGTLVVLGPDTTVPVTQQRVLAVNANSGPTPIGILAPTDPDDPPAVLTVTVNALPTDGTVVLSDGVTPVSAGQTLTVNQLTTLQFIPTPNLDGQSSTLTYSVSDPVGNTGVGTAFLGINLPAPPNSPDLINGLGGPEGFGENALPQNDDDSSSAIDITAVFGSGLNFFGSVFTSLYVNNNGNITFNGPLSTFTPQSIDAGFGNPIIAAFWADVDTEGDPGVPTGGNATGSNTVYWDLDTVNHVFTATWDDVGYYNNHNDKLDAFQLRLIDQGGGNFDIEFRYQAIYWTTGDLDDPATEAARAGFSAGDGVNSYELPQSGDQNAMLGLPSNPAPDGTQGTTGETGVYRFQVRNGEIAPPIPTALALSPASDSGNPNDDRTNDTTPTITGDGGVSGDTITLLANGTVVGTGTVAANSTTWSVTTSSLPDGNYNLTASQTSGSSVSAASATLSVTIDTSAPVTVPVSLTVQPNAGPAPIGIALPGDPDDNFADPNQAPAIFVASLPTNGTVTIGGVTPVSIGQQLTTGQLTGLDFTPTGQLGSTSSFTYTLTDLAGNSSTGTATFSIGTAAGGRWIFSADAASGFSGVVLGINNGVAPVFPTPVAGKLNFEVFTNSTVSALPNPDPGFQATILDPGGTLENGFLTGAALQFGGGDFLVVDSVAGASTQGPSKITLGTGNQTVVGAGFDTLVGGSGNQVLSALVGNETVVGGTGKDSVWGGANDSIVAGSGPDNQIVVIGSGTRVVAGTAGSATISLTLGDTVTALPGNQNVVISAASQVYVDLTGNTGLGGVIGSSGDTIVAGGGTTNVESSNGRMLVKVGAAGKTNVSGSGNAVAGGNTIIGGSGELNYNPSLVSGAGDLIDLSGSGGTAQINAFSFGSVRSFGRDTILGSNTADSVFGGDGDRIGTGNGPIVGGAHQWVHADTVAGTSVGFGSNDTVSSTTYDTVAGVATRGTGAGTSSAQVTVGGFNTATDFIFYQNETAATNTVIVATSQATTVNGIASTTLVTPDGTVMTLVGVSQAQLTAALGAGSLFKL